MADLPKVKAIVLPTATGKSFLVKRGLPMYVHEADDLCHPRATQSLSMLRDQAKVSGNWREYDTALAGCMQMKLSDGDIVLMAAYDLASALGAEVIGCLVLRRDLWEQNVSARGEVIEKYLPCYQDAMGHGAAVIQSYDDLYAEVLRLCKMTKTVSEEVDT